MNSKVFKTVWLSYTVHSWRVEILESLPETVSILGCVTAGFTHFFFRDPSLRDIPALHLNVIHLLFEGRCLPTLKSAKVDSHNPVSL